MRGLVLPSLPYMVGLVVFAELVGGGRLSAYLGGLTQAAVALLSMRPLCGGLLERWMSRPGRPREHAHYDASLSWLGWAAACVVACCALVPVPLRVEDDVKRCGVA